MSNNAAETMLVSILEDLDNMGVGNDDEDVDGGNAVEYLNELRKDIKTFLKV